MSKLSSNQLAFLAQYGTDAQIDRHDLASHPSDQVRTNVALRKSPNKYHDQLVKDPSAYVRSMVASFGTDKHRSQLIKDPDLNVRYEVARTGNALHALKS